MAAGHELAQVNIALAREPLHRPLLADFMAALAPVNARADVAPGFRWRLQAASGVATGFPHVGPEDRLIVNLSVWASLEALRTFVYDDPEHLAVMRRRREWFERLELHTVLWWVPAGHRPSVAEAEERLERLRECGPGPEAFTFRLRHPAPSSVDPERGPVADARDLCPA